MRLIGSISTEKLAQKFSSFLLYKGIANYYEPSTDPTSGKEEFLVWIEDEDKVDEVSQWFASFQENPEKEEFAHSLVQPMPPQSVFTAPSKVKTAPVKGKPSFFLTYLLIFLCVGIFIWDLQSAERIVKQQGLLSFEKGKTPIERVFLYDYPKAFQEQEEVVLKYSIRSREELAEMPTNVQKLFHDAENMPYWKGLYDMMVTKQLFDAKVWKETPLFEKIQKGEFWRVFTPAFLHLDLLHILFNLIWVWVLGRQIEPRLGRWRMTCLLALIAVISNTAQYLMSGPDFIGISGVVCGMVGFIWVRQKIAPWEGYPLVKEATYFLLIFILVMFSLQVVLFFLEISSVLSLPFVIANTAHIIGAISGMLLAKTYFFAVK